MSDHDKPTDPAPADFEAKLGGQLAELELAVVRVGECMGRVMTTVNAIKVSQLTVEHRVHAISDAKRNDRTWLVDLERRLRELEKDTAAE